MKATAMLEKQHQKARGLLEKLEKGANEAVLRELANDLAAHMTIEQQIFYPAVREVRPDLVAESFEEHAIVELELKRLLAASPDSPAYQARVRTLEDLVFHHAEEEEDELFPAVENALTEGELLELGKRMRALFEESIEQGFAELVPKGMSNTSSDVDNKSARGRPPSGARTDQERP